MRHYPEKKKAGGLPITEAIVTGWRDTARPASSLSPRRPTRSLPGPMSNGTSSRSLPHVSGRGSGAIRGSIAARYSQDRDVDSFSSQLDLLRNAEHVVDLDAEVADGALELRMPDEELDGSRCRSSCRSAPPSADTSNGCRTRSCPARRSQPKLGRSAHIGVSTGGAALGSGSGRGTLSSSSTFGSQFLVDV